MFCEEKLALLTEFYQNVGNNSIFASVALKELEKENLHILLKFPETRENLYYITC